MVSSSLAGQKSDAEQYALSLVSQAQQKLQQMKEKLWQNEENLQAKEKSLNEFVNEINKRNYELQRQEEEMKKMKEQIVKKKRKHKELKANVESLKELNQQKDKVRQDDENSDHVFEVHSSPILTIYNILISYRKSKTTLKRRKRNRIKSKE